jgi:hypothetical protein
MSDMELVLAKPLKASGKISVKEMEIRSSGLSVAE